MNIDNCQTYLLLHIEGLAAHLGQVISGVVTAAKLRCLCGEWLWLPLTVDPVAGIIGDNACFGWSLKIEVLLRDVALHDGPIKWCLDAISNALTFRRR